MERKEAIEVVKKNYPHVNVSGSQFETALRTLIPELAESENERIRKWLICTLKSLNNSPVQIDGAYEMMLPAIDWLKSLRPQNTWKPSKHELEVLRLAAEKDGACLMGLYQQLKKLR